MNDRKIIFFFNIYKSYNIFCLKNGFKLAIKFHWRGPQLRAAHAVAGRRFNPPEWQYNIYVHPYVCTVV